jgi:hypothetical protein
MRTGFEIIMVNVQVSPMDKAERTDLNKRDILGKEKPLCRSCCSLADRDITLANLDSERKTVPP